MFALHTVIIAWCSDANGILQCPEIVSISELDDLETIATLHVTNPLIGLTMRNIISQSCDCTVKVLSTIASSYSVNFFGTDTRAQCMILSYDVSHC